MSSFGATSRQHVGKYISSYDLVIWKKIYMRIKEIQLDFSKAKIQGYKNV